MANLTRRAALAGAFSLTTAPAAFAAIPAGLAQHPGFRAWTPPTRASGLPLRDTVETDAGARQLADWLNHRPAVVALWASWCAPCLVEKPHQAALGERLSRAGASARILALQAYDGGVSFERGRALLSRLGADGMPCARAMPEIEQSLTRMLAGGRRTTDTVLPTVLLIGADGLEIGRAVGAMTGPDGRTDYWQDESSFDFLSRLL